MAAPLFPTDADVAKNTCSASHAPTVVTTNTAFTAKPAWFAACTGRYSAYVETLDAPARMQPSGFTDASVSTGTGDGANAGSWRAGSFFVSEPSDYHEYAMDWYVHPGSGKVPGVTAAHNYVNFYFNGFLVFQTRHWMPMRAGRLVIGPWMGWWRPGSSPPCMASCRFLSLPCPGGIRQRTGITTWTSYVPKLSVLEIPVLK